MNSKIKVDSHLIDELLLDVLMQCCSYENSEEIDNMCISAYEEACDYLAEQGYLQTKNGRIYTLTSKTFEENEK